MNEKGIQPPPKRPMIDAPDRWAPWDRWFRLLVFAFAKVQTFAVSINPTSVGANTTSEQTFSVPGLTTEDIVTVNKPSHQTGLGIAGARVSAANTLAITFMNTTAGSIDPSSETYKIVAVRR